MSWQQDFYQALTEADPVVPAGLRTWNGSDPAARLAVYRNNVLTALIEALAASFPVVEALVGVPFFRAMAHHFVSQHPPTSPLLAEYGADLPRFIRQFAPAAAVPYLADVAELEWRYIQAFHCADGRGIDAAALARVLEDERQLPARKLIFHPSLQCIHSSYAVLSIWAAHQSEHDGNHSQPVGQQLAQLSLESPEQGILIRTGLNVHLLALDIGSYRFISALQQGMTLGEAMMHVQLQDAGFDVTPGLQLLLQQQAVMGFSQPVTQGEPK
ncbi:putative DNA-binding domain-containing protein [Pseudaeromonas sharmana]|uniref:DNA-binding domain-containing protein n=1 Tax=Pseudaeromonas sharmana TaxID=328412 RepID=A0ABV8CQF1_9GAMM